MFPICSTVETTELWLTPGFCVACPRGIEPLHERRNTYDFWRGLGVIKDYGQSILVIDKNLDALMKLADRHCIMENGRVVWRGRTAELAGDETLKSRYLGV